MNSAPAVRGGLKVLPPARADHVALRSRLLREARAALALNHPNIVTIYEAGSADGRFHRHGIRRGHDALPPHSATGHATARGFSGDSLIASSLGAAHAAGIVHRDLNPANARLTLSQFLFQIV